MYPITDKLDIYGLLGYAKTDVGNIKSYNGSGLSWGVGVDYFFDDNEKDKNSDSNDFGLFLEYQSLIEKSNAPDIYGFNLGLLYRF